MSICRFGNEIPGGTRGRAAEPAKVVPEWPVTFWINLAGGFDYFGTEGAERLWLLAQQSKILSFKK